jgi:hypothetical protein
MYDKPKKILVSDSADQVVAHQLSDNMIELKRLDQKIIITGTDFSVMATSPKSINGQHPYTTITVTDGKVDAGEISYKPDAPQPPAGKKQKVDEKGEPVVDDKGEPVWEDDPDNPAPTE